MKKYFLFLFLGMLCLTGMILAVSVLSPEVEQKQIVLHEIRLENPEGTQLRLNVEHAVTEEEKRIGFMYRRSIRYGMLFFFETEVPQTFWMKNTRVPLDIMFFDNEGRFVSSATMHPCTLDPCPVFTSEDDARYALEMPAGFLEHTPVGKGWKLVL